MAIKPKKPFNIQNTLKSKEKENSSYYKKKTFSLLDKISTKDKVRLYADMSMLLSSGIDINNCYVILIDQFSSNKKLTSVLISIQRQTQQGKTIVESFSNSYGFTDFEVFNLRIGEDSNNLVEVLDNLSKFFESKIALKRDIISILTYPAIIILITIGVLYFMLSTVVPMFAGVFTQFGSELPYLTKKILSLSNNIDVIMYWVLAFLFFIVLTNYLINSRVSLMIKRERILFKIPVFGNLFKSVAMSRFCTSMSLLLNSNIPLNNALSLCSDIIKYKSFQAAIRTVEQNISEGTSFYEAMSRQPLFSQKIVTMIRVGENTNQLDKIFIEMRNQYDAEVNYKAKLIGTIIEPLIIVVIGAIVGVVMVSMYAPMFDMSKILQPL